MSEETIAAQPEASIPTDPFAWWKPRYNVGPEIITAMADARKQMGKIGTSGKNTYDGYDYSNMKDYAEGVESGLEKTGLVVVVEIVKPRFFNSGHDKVPHACHSLLCGHVYHISGQSLPFTFIGEAYDRADKASYKAVTGGRKYALGCLFNLKGGTDPESDETVSKAAAEGNPFREDKRPRSSSRRNAPPADASKSADAPVAKGSARNRDPFVAAQKKFVEAKDAVEFDMFLKHCQDSEKLKGDQPLFGKILLFAGNHFEARKQKGSFKPDDPAVQAIEDRLKAIGDAIAALEAQNAPAEQAPATHKQGMF